MNIIVLILCLYIIVKCVSYLTKMDKKTSHGVYAYHLLFSVASFSLLVLVTKGHEATIVEILFIIGMSIRYMFNRRSTRYELREE